MRKMIAALAAVVAMTTGAFAIDCGPSPANYEAAAEAYIASRLEDSRNLRLDFVGEPYQVVAEMTGRDGLACWAVDVRVKARQTNGASGRYVPYTVLFHSGAPVAFEDDVRRMTRV